MLIDANMVIERMRWTEAHMAEMDGHTGRTVAAPMRGIMQSMIKLMEIWRDSMADDSRRLGDSDVHLVEPGDTHHHIREMAERVIDLQTLLCGSPEDTRD
ncbi:hypothetical protein [Streptomyces bluensis]|uniref:hypothetical protein n=1 Tax=Streptomyces bluensis TaxID=33897 RepID=UPI00167AF076|nr:hypothetical protein [Streptomyces bluensis]GGZ70078.1 hypothetical protein GCM10010344_41330 [Streptomyces bluensis]